MSDTARTLLYHLLLTAAMAKWCEFVAKRMTHISHPQLRVQDFDCPGYVTIGAQTDPDTLYLASR